MSILGLTTKSQHPSGIQPRSSTWLSPSPFFRHSVDLARFRLSLVPSCSVCSGSCSPSSFFSFSLAVLRPISKPHYNQTLTLIMNGIHDKEFAWSILALHSKPDIGWNSASLCWKGKGIGLSLTVCGMNGANSVKAYTEPSKKLALQKTANSGRIHAILVTFILSLDLPSFCDVCTSQLSLLERLMTTLPPFDQLNVDTFPMPQTT
jgi:hypothetical protein